MKVIESSKKGRSGKAVVKVFPSKVKVLMEGDEDMLVFSKADCPPVSANGIYRVTLSGDESKVNSAVPWMATCRAKFVGMVVPREGDIPAPKQHPGGPAKTKDGRAYVMDPYMTFMPKLRITSAPYEGINVAVFLHYLFADDGNGNLCVKGYGKNKDLLVSFLDACGVLDMDITYKENVLPGLQKRILKAEKEFLINIKEGWVDYIGPAPEMDDSDDEDMDEGDEGVEVDDEADDEADDEETDDEETDDIPF